MLTINVTNKMDDVGKFSFYKAEVLVNGHAIARGDDIPHYRPSGWRQLLLKVANQCESVEGESNA